MLQVCDWIQPSCRMGWEPVKAIRTTWYACTWYDLSELGRRHCRKGKKSWKGVRCAIVLHTHTHTHTHTHMHAPSLSLLLSRATLLCATGSGQYFPWIQSAYARQPPPSEGGELLVCFACYYLRDKPMSELFHDRTEFVAVSARSHDLKSVTLVVSVWVLVKAIIFYFLNLSVALNKDVTDFEINTYYQ